MAKITKLTEGALNSAFSKRFTQRKLIIDVNGNNYEVLVDEHVQQSKLEDLFTELFQKYELSQKENLGLDTSIYAQVLLIKYFTNLPMTDDLGKQLAIFIKLKDLDILDSIMNVIQESELNEMMPKVMDTFKNKIVSGEMNKYMLEHPEEAMKMVSLGDLFKGEKVDIENNDYVNDVIDNLQKKIDEDKMV